MGCIIFFVLVVFPQNKLLIHECLKEVVAEQYKSTDNSYMDDIDKKVDEIPICAGYFYHRQHFNLLAMC